MWKRHKTVIHYSDSPVRSYVWQYFNQHLLFFSEKNSKQESKFFFSPPLCWSENPSSHWSNCNLPVQTQLHQWAFIAPQPPLDTKICTAAALLPRNWMSFQEYPPFHKQDSVTGSTANSPSPQTWFPISARALYTTPKDTLSGARLSNESSDVIEIVKIGWKELHNCTFSKRRTSLLLSFWYHFPITGDLNLCSINVYWVMSSVI